MTGRIWRRVVDSHKWPGRLISRVRLWRITETVSIWVVLWTVLVVIAARIAFDETVDDPVRWIANWVLGGSFAALLAATWQNVIKCPRTARRIRRRIVSEPEALLRTTLAELTTKIVELDPPVGTVPRDELYDELLPGALARKKDVQIIVGDPGAGKTTALIDLAGVLAKIGMVPILLGLRGKNTSEDLFALACEQFKRQVRPFVRTDAEADIVWRWLSRRRRLAILVDDIDQIGFDGEPGFVMRRLLENVATEGQAVIVTARPAGVPMGIAASAITIEPLDFDTTVELAARPASREPGATTSTPPPRDEIKRWVREGELTDAPLYLEALAELTSVGSCPNLPENPRQWGATRRPGRWRELSSTKHEWAPLWVRYMLLDRYYAGIVDGNVRRSLGIDQSDRKRSVDALEAAALGTLGASGREALVAAVHGDEPKEARAGRPRRTELAEFMSADDRHSFNADPAKRRGRRLEVSQHEAIDTCERLRILEPDWRGQPQFRHRIMQAFLAGRSLARLGRLERERRRLTTAAGSNVLGPVTSFDAWVMTLMDRHHPEKLTAHLALTFAAIHADERFLQTANENWDGLAEWILRRLVEVTEDSTRVEGRRWERGSKLDARLQQLDPSKAPDPHMRTDPDDDLIKLTTAANLATVLHRQEDERPRYRDRITKMISKTGGAMRWTKLQAVPAIAGLGGKEAWLAIWEHFTHDADYDVRRAASKQLERNAWTAYPKLWHRIECHLLHAGHCAAEGQALEPDERSSEWSMESFVALGWVLPAIVSGLSEELRAGGDEDATADPPGPLASWAKRRQAPHTREEQLACARRQLVDFATLAFEGRRPELEDSLAQGFKADAMRHALDPPTFKGPGWVASNRRLVADVGLPHAESWYARMLLYQALSLYSIAGMNTNDTFDMLSFRLHATRERHPLARQAASLARTALRHAQLHGSRWEAFIWSDDVEDAGRLPAVLSRRTAQLVGDVALLVDLKEGSPADRHENFGHMEELPYCLSESSNRHEILGSGCPPHCGWGFCPYRAASPDEPNEHRGLSRGFCRGERRIAKPVTRRSAWQRSISRRRMREFWEQMEFKARR